MASLPVDTVFFARYTISNFRSLYRRFPTPPATYTKDYFQLADQTENTLKQTFGYAGQPVAIEYVWPGGSRAGQFLFSSDRVHLSWPTGGPEPWRVGVNDVDGVISIPGDPAKQSAADADAEFNRITALGHVPWLFGVVLAGQPTRMHVRVFFENPPAGFEDRSIADLPEQIRQKISDLAGNVGTGAFRVPSWAPARAASLVRQIQDALQRNPNVLLVGPPGTGKTVALEDLRARYSVSSGTTIDFDPDVWGAAAFSVGQTVGERRSESLVFHPSYGYENFVAGLFPTASEKGGIGLEAVPGPLLRLSHWVGRSERQALLILDEFNRGPAAAIFGDTLGLLDKDKRATPTHGGAHIQRPHPDHSMKVAEDYATKEGAKDEMVAKQISLPLGIAIVAAMNSTDRSVAPLDAAMRRRFHVIRVNPDYTVLAEHFGLTADDIDNGPLPAADAPGNWTRQHVLTLAVRVLKSINERVRFCLGEDFLLGHALLWGLTAATDESALRDLAAAMDGFVLSTLRTTFLDQDDFLAAVLGVPDKPADGAQSVGYWQQPPKGLDQVASRRLVLHDLSSLPPAAQLSALAALATT